MITYAIRVQMSDVLLQEAYDDFINTPPELQDTVSEKDSDENLSQASIMKIKEPILLSSTKILKKRGPKPKNNEFNSNDFFDDFQKYTRDLDELDPNKLDFDFGNNDEYDFGFQSDTGFDKENNQPFKKKSIMIDTNESIFSLMPDELKFVNPAECENDLLKRPDDEELNGFKVISMNVFFSP